MLYEAKTDSGMTTEGRSTKGEEEPPSKKTGPQGTGTESAMISGFLEMGRKLLDQIPPELRDKVIEQAKTRGPDAALVAVNLAAGKARGLKTRMALKALSAILSALINKPSQPR